MAILSKAIITTYIPASPGTPGSPGTPPTPARSVRTCYSTPGGTSTNYTPVYGPCPSDGGVVLGQSSCVVSYIRTTTTVPAGTVCEVSYTPATSGSPAVPSTPPSPAQVIENFQPGWNASAQSIQGLLPGKAAKFKIKNGSRGVLVGFAPETWLPRLSDMPFGVMFYDGSARVYEYGVEKETLDTFFHGEEFLIGRSLDNYIVYLNLTTNKWVIRKRMPASPLTPVHLFALMYYGGDAVLI